MCVTVTCHYEQPHSNPHTLISIKIKPVIHNSNIQGLHQDIHSAIEKNFSVTVLYVVIGIQ